METYIWLGIALVSVLVEMATAGLAAIWFAPAAIISMVLAICGLPLSVQISVFIVASGLFMLLFYKKLRDNIENKTEKTNLDAIIGKEGIAEEDIMPRGTGRIKVGGISWSAYTDKNALPITKGDYVKILAIDGVKLLVEKQADEILTK